MDVEPNDLVLFARIVEAGSLSKAAERMDQPKSTVSRRLAQLETQLGERLLQRTTRKLVLTDFGAIVLEHARAVAHETEAAGALAQHRQGEPSGRLRVSMPQDFANLGMNDVLGEYMARYPKVALELDLSPRRVDLVAEGFDVAIRMGDLPDDSSLAARRVLTERQGLFASPAYIAQRGLPEHPDELLQHDLLCVLRRTGGPVPWTLQRGKTVWQRELTARLVANSPDLLARVACSGVGIAASTYMFARHLVESGELVRVLPEWELPVSVGWAVFPGRRLMPAKTRAFLDLMAERCCEVV
ncbi:LysR family transcriptional regulator [Pseudoduganella sp. GCM10020061]|uniref:LysR family transcriptional regulator n=1 Tax=Pseudoduganella sp. GCM10020061 TaxID=3317345 RepID=UPI00362BC4ED